MQATAYDSPHGLMNKLNISTAEDQAVLVNECMRIDFFRKVVGTKNYETVALKGSPVNPSNGGISYYRWESTNKLLGV